MQAYIPLFGDLIRTEQGESYRFIRDCRINEGAWMVLGSGGRLLSLHPSLGMRFLRAPPAEHVEVGRFASTETVCDTCRDTHCADPDAHGGQFGAPCPDCGGSRCGICELRHSRHKAVRASLILDEDGAPALFGAEDAGDVVAMAEETFGGIEDDEPPADFDLRARFAALRR